MDGAPEVPLSQEVRRWSDNTDLRILVRCQSGAHRDTILEMGWREGTAEMLDRLAAYLPEV